MFEQMFDQTAKNRETLPPMNTGCPDLRSSGKTVVGQALRRNSFIHRTPVSKPREQTKD